MAACDVEEIDDKTFGQGFDCFAENAVRNLGVADWLGREMIRRNLRAVIDKGFTALQRQSASGAFPPARIWRRSTTPCATRMGCSVRPTTQVFGKSQPRRAHLVALPEPLEAASPKENVLTRKIAVSVLIPSETIRPRSELRARDRDGRRVEAGIESTEDTMKADYVRHALTRRHLLGQATLAGVALATGPAWAETLVQLPLPGGPDQRSMTKAFPQKGAMILQRSRPPLLETPFEVFDQDVFTPNDQFYVRWHWALIPTEVDVDKFRMAVRGHVNRVLSLSLKDILALPPVEIAAVNQCSGNSRGFFEPRVAGGQWANGAMGNARWMGVRLKDVLDRAGVKAGAVQVRLNGMDEPVVPDAPDFKKSLDIDHARDGEVMIAYAMNGQQLPLLNGFPLRLVVPGWYATYWVKAINDIEVLDQPDDNFWTKTAYTIPDTPRADIKPGQTGVKMVPINKMVPRSFITNIKSGDTLRAHASTLVRGIAFGGDAGVAGVDLSSDGGKSWQATRLGKDEGKYSFRKWQAAVTLPATGPHTLTVRCTNVGGLAQPGQANWNPSGFMRNAIEATPIIVA
jgi:DMSO/TMAO reductase YedYZ molybdopterin-dependent catalytic subunit